MYLYIHGPRLHFGVLISWSNIGGWEGWGKLIVRGIFCDLSKAFDCVNHRILLSKLDHYGIRGTFKALIDSYLKERYQRMTTTEKTNLHYSDWELVKHGAPQGSILSPLLFLLYINDLPTVTTNNAKLVLYADDTSLIITSSSHTEFVTKLNNIFFRSTNGLGAICYF